MPRRTASGATYKSSVAELTKMYLGGSSLRECAVTFGVSVPTVKTWLARAGVPTRTTGEGSRLRIQAQGATLRLDIPEDWLRQLYIEQSLSVFRISQVLGVTCDAVRLRIARYGLTRTPEQKKAAREVSNTLRRTTCIETYGGVSPNAAPNVRERTAATNIERYGVTNPIEMVPSPLTSESKAVLSSRDSLGFYLDALSSPTIGQIADGLGCSASLVGRRLREFGLSDRVVRPVSYPELELQSLVASWGFTAHKTRQVIPPYEIDLYVPERQLGIEYNGNYWHSEINKERLYHQRKSLTAAKAGVRMYHIFEYNWNDERKRPIIVGQLRHLLGLSERCIGARKTNVVELNAARKNVFLDANHLQGRDHASVKLGLEYDGELVSTMTFRRPHIANQHGEKYQWELSRFASVVGAAVPGAAGKLFAHFIREHVPESVLSYSDLSRSHGGLYEQLGFACERTSPPNYVWSDLGGTVLSRYRTQMKNEVEVMRERGFVRVYDCGSKVWVWHPDTRTPAT